MSPTIPTRRARGERGQLTVLVIGFFVVLVLFVVVIANLSVVFIRHRSLDAAADGAALAATDAVDPVRHGGSREVVLDQGRAEQAARDHLTAAGAYTRFPGLQEGTDTDGDTVDVDLSWTMELPFVPQGWIGEVTLTSHADGRARVGG